MLQIYLQSEAIYGLENKDFVQICLCNRWNNLYCDAILDQQFFILQKILISFGKKRWLFYKEYFFKRDKIIIRRNLEELELVQTKIIPWQKRRLIFQDPTVNYTEKK